DELHGRELEMLDPLTRSDPRRMKELLRDDFVEFGSSGRVYEKRVLIDMLAKESHAEVLIRDFSVRELAPSTALVTYRSVGQSGQEARRSSIWVKEADEWRMVFHQGTRIPNSWGLIS
ncbi:MAG: DUF4440 domain-containing protein, partial [Actinomycetota bacterium]|nr:DUF4440 domain-containing protein [Actinomycetota bacterium]